MTAYQLSSMRLILERARALLSRADADPDTSELLGTLSSVIEAIAVAEAVSTPGPQSTRLLLEARQVYARAGAWASRRGLTMPAAPAAPTARHDTDHTLSTVDILEAIAGMKPGDAAPPVGIVPTLVEAAGGPEPTPDPKGFGGKTIPSPPETLEDLPPSRPHFLPATSFLDEEDPT